ncbi:MAG: sulfatase-like hydrolase/transferase, partial [Candidatus Nitrotoga sp.]
MGRLIKKIKDIFLKPWSAFVFLAIVILGCATIFGLVRPPDGLKSFVWFILLGTFCIFVDGKTSRKYPHYLCWAVFFVVFVVDLASQGVVRQFFGATPQPGVIAGALANTNPDETKNFIIEQRYTIIRSVIFASLSFFIIGLFNKKYLKALRMDIQKINRRTYVFWAVLIIALHFNPTMLRQQPFLRWFVVFMRHAEAQEEMRKIKDIRSAIEFNQSKWNLTGQNNEETVVLVIGESANRNNWGQYGYSRPTTLPLENTLKKLPGATVWFAQAKSSEAFTLSSLQQALTSATKANPDAWKLSPDIIMLAKAAGYHITWLSNQPSSEGWVSALGKSADVYKFINHGNWRDSSATDMDLLPELKKQLLVCL